MFCFRLAENPIQIKKLHYWRHVSQQICELKLTFEIGVRPFEYERAICGGLCADASRELSVGQISTNSLISLIKQCWLSLIEQGLLSSGLSLCVSPYSVCFAFAMSHKIHTILQFFFPIAIFVHNRLNRVEVGLISFSFAVICVGDARARQQTSTIHFSHRGVSIMS